ncbi:Dam family site-specific DNA-(adenine-N6)-methyltransferase [Corynebacterium tuberculostearicum]|uniref:Dam family site-specific DNA-(adenine-N6)-methyltransferase n=1 Tax=Corynebacterium tuberculostearicum TaxID=38304 RepID=UPI0038D1B7EB
MRYIGSKRLLIDEIDDILCRHLTGDESSFLDLFGGTNVVGNAFKKKFTIYSNDLLYFSYLHGKATLENNTKPSFSKLKASGVEKPLEVLSSLAEKRLESHEVGYYEMAYSPTGGANYFTVDNAKRIDAIRETIDYWHENALLGEVENAYLVSSLVQALPQVSNITGTYGAYLKRWDKRALKCLELEPLQVWDNSKPNKSFNENAEDLVARIQTDVVYIDTPYNNRQYASNYHVLENVARNGHPELRGKTKIFDWSDLKSDFATQRGAFSAMRRLLENVHSKHLVLSYNNEGIIPESDLLGLLEEISVIGSLEVRRIPYRKYKSKKISGRDGLYEILAYCKPRTGLNMSRLSSDGRGQNEELTSWIPAEGRLLKSPLNYVGGKYRLLKQILPRIPAGIETFVEPFSGAANVGINVPARKHVLNDMNSRLNSMFRYFASVEDADQLIATIWRRISEAGLSKTDEEAFKTFRQKYNSAPNPLDLFILTCYSYNYQLRFNSRMEYNNPFGRNRSSFTSKTERNLRRFIARLHEMNVQFTDRYFQEMDFSKYGPQDFVYCDPPYLITTGSYNDGNRGFRNWGEVEEAELYSLLKRLSHQGVRWALSNVTEHKGRRNQLLLDFIESQNANVYRLNFGYGNSSYNTSKGGSAEVLVTNYSAVD